MESPLVSIIIPIFKVEKFLERCLYSVLHQSYKNIECILVDDVSPDSSFQIAQDFISNHPTYNFVITQHQVNSGLSVARNTGIDLAKGQFIYFLDSDDEINEYAIEHLVKLAQETQAEMVLGHCVCINEKEGWERDYFPIVSKKDVLEGNTNLLRDFVRGEYPVMACDKLTSLEFLKKYRLYFVPDLFSQDVLWSFQCALKLNKIAFLREDTYKYYFHEASIIHNRGKKHFENWITIAEYMDKAYDEEADKYRKNLILDYLIGFKSQTLEMNWKAQKDEALWKKSYNAYSSFKSLSLVDYFSNNFSLSTKKQNLFLSLPTRLGFRFFRWRFER